MSTLSAENDTRAPQPPAKTRLSWSQRFSNNWPVVPVRIFLGALFLFAGYAKFSYPGFFDDANQQGLKQLMQRAKPDSPIGSALTPIINNASLLGHITAGAEFAIGAGLVVGLLTRLAALGGIVLTTLIALSYNWDSIKEYTAISGWFTSVDIAIAVALTVFVLGGAGPLSFDRLFSILQARRDAREDAEPGFGDTDPDEARQRLQPAGAQYPANQYAPPAYPEPAYPAPAHPAPAYPETAYPATPPATAYPPPAYPPAAYPTTTHSAAATHSAAPPAPAAEDATSVYRPVPPAHRPDDGSTQQLPAVPAPTAHEEHQTQVYPPLRDDIEHDEAAELEAEPRGRLDEASSVQPVPPDSDNRR